MKIKITFEEIIDTEEYFGKDVENVFEGFKERLLDHFYDEPGYILDELKFEKISEVAPI